MGAYVAIMANFLARRVERCNGSHKLGVRMGLTAAVRYKMAESKRGVGAVCYHSRCGEHQERPNRPNNTLKFPLFMPVQSFN